MCGGCPANTNFHDGPGGAGLSAFSQRGEVPVRQGWDMDAPTHSCWGRLVVRSPVGADPLPAFGQGENLDPLLCE